MGFPGNFLALRLAAASPLSYVQVLSTIYNHFPDAATLSQVYSGRCYTLSRCPENVPYLGSCANIRSKSTPVYRQKSSKNRSNKQK